MSERCPLCGHFLIDHKVTPYTLGNVDLMRLLKVECIASKYLGEEEKCNCNVGFKDVEITVEVKVRENEC